MFIFQIKTLDFLLPLPAVEYKMEVKNPSKIIFLCLSFWSLQLVSFGWSDEKLKLIERVDVKKKILAKSLIDKTDGKLKNYRTFSFKLEKRLIFCHISNDESSPRIICY